MDLDLSIAIWATLLIGGSQSFHHRHALLGSGNIKISTVAVRLWYCIVKR